MKNKEDGEPLVSIIVITYNSSKYVIETLESIKKQTYQNIELIISDDSSKDNTVEICEKWVSEYKSFFSRAVVTKSKLNKGIPGNCNTGLKQSKGDWIKLIAGDDLLLEDCIENNMNFVLENTNCKFLFSRPIFFNDDNTNFDHINSTFEKRPKFYKLSAETQFLHLLIKNYPMSPPTIFYNRNVLDQIGGFDERYPNEDFPLYLKVTKAGYKLHFLPVATIKYRYHSKSLSFRKNNEAINFWKRLKFRKTIRQYVSWRLFMNHPLIALDYYNQLIIYEMVILLGNSKWFLNILKPLRFISPLYFLEKFTGKTGYKFGNFR